MRVKGRTRGNPEVIGNLLLPWAWPCVVEVRAKSGLYRVGIEIERDKFRPSLVPEHNLTQ